MRLLIHLSPQLHNSIKFDYYMVYMKHYVWIPMKRKAQNLYMICVSPGNYSLLVTHAKQTDPDHMLAAPIRCETLPPAIRNKALACLATRFGIQKSTVQSVIKLDQPIAQYGRVRCLGGGDFMVGRHFVKQSEDSRDASFVRVSLAFFPYVQSLSISSPVYPACRSTCSPS
jgi:hypothetical protein